MMLELREGLTCCICNKRDSVIMPLVDTDVGFKDAPVCKLCLEAIQYSAGYGKYWHIGPLVVYLAKRIGLGA